MIMGFSRPRSLVAFLALGAVGCDPVPYGNSCRSYTELYCETCTTTSWDATTCLCVTEGEVTAGDLPEGTELTNAEATAWCDQVLAGLNYPGPSTAASCKRDLEFLQKYEKDACPVEAVDTTYDYSDSG